MIKFKWWWFDKEAILPGRDIPPPPTQLPLPRLTIYDQNDNIIGRKWNNLAIPFEVMMPADGFPLKISFWDPEFPEGTTIIYEINNGFPGNNSPTAVPGTTEDDGTKITITDPPESYPIIITAVAMKSGYDHSDTLYAAMMVIEPGTVSKPVIHPEGGRYFIEDLEAEIYHPDPAATIHYTTSGEDPTSSSPEYTAPIQFSNLDIGDEIVIKAIAVKDAHYDSAVETAIYNVERQWIEGNNGEYIEIDKISDFNIDPITSLDSNFNIREPRTANITIVNDEEDTAIQEFIEKLLEAEEFKKEVMIEFDTGIYEKKEERLDVVKIKIQIYGEYSYPIFMGYIEKNSININEKSLTISFSAIDPLCLYKALIENAFVKTEFPDNPDRFLSVHEVIEVLFNRKLAIEEENRLIYETGLDEETELINVDEIRKEVRALMPGPDEIKLMSLDVIGATFGTFNFYIENSSSPIYLGLEKAGLAINWEIKHIFLRGLEFHDWITNFGNSVRLSGTLRIRQNLPYEIKVEYIAGFRASENEPYGDNHSYQDADGIYFWIFRHTKAKLPILNLAGQNTMLTVCVQEWKRYKILDGVFPDNDISGYTFDYKTKGGTPYSLDNYRSYFDFISGGFMIGFNAYWQWVKNTLINEETNIVTYFLNKAESSFHSAAGNPRATQLSLKYTGTIKIQNLDFGEATIPAIDMLTFIAFTTGSYIYYNERIDRIMFQERNKLIIGNPENVVSLDKAEEDDLITDIITGKQYYEAYDSEKILEIYYRRTIGHVMMYNKLYETIFHRNIIQENISIHNSAKYIKPDTSIHGIVQNITLNNIIKFRNRYYRIMGISFDDENITEYMLWRIGKAPVPSIMPLPGVYYKPVEIYLICLTINDVEIRYTTDGSEPTETSTLYTQGVPMELTETTVLKIKAFHWLYEPSNTLKARYIILT